MSPPSPPTDRVHDGLTATSSNPLVDLTEDSSDSTFDHMHTVVSLSRPETLSVNTPGNQRKRKNIGYPHRHSQAHTNARYTSAPDPLQTQSTATDYAEQTREIPCSRFRMSRRTDTLNDVTASETPTRPPPAVVSHLTTPERSIQIVGSTSRRSNGKKPSVQPFAFLALPPEIRNSVYRALLTTPNAPIELPRLTGAYGRKHADQWRACTTTKMKRRHKSIFLEILGTCRQIHDEASGIMYGCNVFKYRSDHREGPRNVVLPTRHLQLLKHIKISVISGEPNNGQDRWVTDLVRCFVKDGMQLETFELTWFGWKKYSLAKDNLVCQTLQSLNVGKHFMIKVMGEARMQTAMKEELEQRLRAKTVEIHRPVCSAFGGDVNDE